MESTSVVKALRRVLSYSIERDLIGQLRVDVHNEPQLGAAGWSPRGKEVEEHRPAGAHEVLGRKDASVSKAHAELWDPLADPSANLDV